MRLFQSLNPQLNIDEINQQAFWEHMENVHNILFPYNQIHFQSNDVGQLVSGLVNKMNTLDQADLLNPSNIMTTMSKVMTPDLMDNIANIIKSGKLSEVFQSLPGM
jgi:hypothetical protein